MTQHPHGPSSITHSSQEMEATQGTSATTQMNLETIMLSEISQEKCIDTV